MTAFITKRARTSIANPMESAWLELQRPSKPWFTHYAPEPAVEQAIGDPVRRCIFCCETLCICDDTNGVETGEVDVYTDDPQGAR